MPPVAAASRIIERMRGPTRGLVACMALVALLQGCGIIERASGQAARRAQAETEQKQLSEAVQLAVMRFSDQYRETITGQSERLAAEFSTARVRIQLLDWAFSQSMAAAVIAAGPNIVTNAVDMVVLVGLSRRVVERHLVPELPRDYADRLVRDYFALEDEAFRLLQLLDPDSSTEQRTELSALMDQWVIDNPEVVRVAYIRFADFAALGKKTQRPVSPGLLGIIGLDLMSGIDPAVVEIERTRQLAERALFYGQRVPVLIDLQVRASAARAVSSPEFVDAMETVRSVGAVSLSSAQLLDEVPMLVAREREAAIAQLLDGLQAQQAEMTALATELRAALEAGALTAGNLDAVVNSADRLLARFEPDPDAPPAEPGRPFDITEYTAALAELNATTRELQALLAGLEGMAPGLSARIDDLTGRTRAIVDYAFWRLVLLVGVVLAAAIAFLLVARALRRRPA